LFARSRIILVFPWVSLMRPQKSAIRIGAIARKPSAGQQMECRYRHAFCRLGSIEGANQMHTSGNRCRQLLLALSVISVDGCSRAPNAEYGGALIAVPGTFPCFNDQLVVKVVHDAGRLNYTVANKKASAGPSKANIEESSPWTIFPESPKRVWVFDGARDVTLIEIYPDGGSKFTSSQVVPGLLQRAPAEFVARLPAEVTRQADDG
jgi:hypothetical protein